MVAYALYKREKLEWLMEQEQISTPVPKEKVEEFTLSRALPRAVESYRNQATIFIERMQDVLYRENEEQIAQIYQEQLVDRLENSDERIKQALDSLIERYKSDMVAQIKAAQPGWLKAIAQNILANIVGVVAVAVVIVVIWSIKVGVVGTVSDITGYDIKEKPSAVDSAQSNALPHPPIK